MGVGAVGRGVALTPAMANRKYSSIFYNLVVVAKDMRVLISCHFVL